MVQATCPPSAVSISQLACSDDSLPSYSTIASEGGVPGRSWVLGAGGVTTGGWGRVLPWTRQVVLGKNGVSSLPPRGLGLLMLCSRQSVLLPSSICPPGDART